MGFSLLPHRRPRPPGSRPELVRKDEKMRTLQVLRSRVRAGWRQRQASLHQERAQTVAEYGLVMSVVAVGVVVPTLLIFSDRLSNAFLGVSGCLVGSC